MHNKTLQTDLIMTRRGRDSTAYVLYVRRTKAVGGSRDLATKSDILFEIFRADFAAERQIRYAAQPSP